jgi:hypothetical protein
MSIQTRGEVMYVTDSENLFDQRLNGLGLRPTTKGLISNMLFDLPLSMAQCDDFGVKTADHYRALKAVLFYSPLDDDPDATKEQVMNEFGQKAKQLDEALGYGEKLNQLIKQHAPQYADVVSFYTIWDEQRKLEAELGIQCRCEQTKKNSN